VIPGPEADGIPRFLNGELPNVSQQNAG
jgi:hypothetical protein